MPPTLPTLTLSTSLTLLALLRLGPESLRSPFLRLLRINSDPDLRLLLRKIAIVLAISSVVTGNRILNYFARNNWVRTRKGEWKWGEEVAVVTGGAGGIGGGVVRGLVGRGVKVAVIDIVEMPENLKGYDNVKFFKCDITSKDEVDATADKIRATFGSPTILCNNAGIADAHTILESTPDHLRKLYDINVLAHYYTVQAFLPDMISRKKGHIVSTCSMSSFITPAGLVDYAGTKAAVMAFHEGLQQELKYRYHAPEIKTSIVHPTYVKTPLVTSYAKALEKSGAIQLEPEYVAKEIVEAILSCSSRQIILPSFLAGTSAVRALPYWVQEGIRSMVKDDMRRLDS